MPAEASEATSGQTPAPADDLRPTYADAFMEALHAARVTFVTALPESLLRDVYARIADDPEIRYVPVTNEAEMPGLVAGAYFGGLRAIMMMENSGLRQACEPIARFALSHQVPMVLVMAYRGDFGEANWWGHNHAQTMEPLLEALRIPYQHVRRLDELRPMVEAALAHAESSQLPVALVIGGDCVDRRPL